MTTDSTNDSAPNRAPEAGKNNGLLAKIYREELTRRIARAIPQDGTAEPLKGLHLARVSRHEGPVYGVSFPSFCFIAQGTKEIYLNEKQYRYDPYHYLLTTVELPIVIQRIEASPEVPYLSFQLELDPASVASVMLEADLPSPRRDVGNVSAIDVSPLDLGLLESAVRLVRLLEAPSTEARVLLSLVKREIIFQLLVGAQNTRLRHLAVLGGHTDRIARAIEKLRNDYNKPLRIDGLARELGMSPSGFHEHFKAVTTMSPLQFQKNLRLQEARRLLLSEDIDAAGAGYQVGYESASQFNKEYKRFFGSPPMRDVGRLRQPVPVDGGATA